MTVTDNLFESNYAVAKDNWHQLASGGGISIIDGGFPMHGRKTVLNNQFINNVVYAGTATWGGGIKVEHTLVTVRGNTFTHNRAELAHEVQYGGGAMWMGWCGFLVENNIFDGNYSSYEGGALAIRGDPTVGREEAIINNTFVGNQAVYRGAGVRAELASCLALVNNIFWDDTSSGGGELCIFDAIAGVAYCDVKGGYEGTGNINVDPAFMPGDSLYRLTASSPCIEGGTDSIQLGTLWFRAPPKDYDALLRPMPAGTRPDIGAHEEQLSMVAYARDAIVNPCTAKPQIDTVHIRATVVNPHEHSLDVTAFAEELSSGNVQDSILLQDDGLHDDGLANDGTWGGIFVPTMEGVFSLDVRTVDAIAGTSRELQHAAAFATAGPLAYVGYRFYQHSVDTIAAPGADLYLHIGVRNLGASCPITGVRGYVSAVDSLVDYVIMPSVTWGTVFPGDTTHYSSTFINVTLGPGRVGGSEASFALQLSSNGYPFWQDTIRFVLTAVEGAEGLLPPYYVLAQNYPNPFNPSTTIRYGLPNRSHVTLAIYNTLGQQVATLVEGEQEAGFHEAVFDASGLASGVYLYRMQAGEFVQTRKLVLLH